MVSRHVLALIAPAWGHTLPYIHLATRLLASDPELAVTIVQHNNIVSKMMKELSTCSYDTSRLKIEGVGESDLPSTSATLGKCFAQLSEKWLEVLAKAVIPGNAWPKPQTLHMDFFGGLVLDETRALLGPEGKILLWCSTLITACMDQCSEYDFVKIAHEIHADEERRRGRTMEEVLGGVVCAANGSDKLDGRVLEIAGGVKIYDHEHQAQGAGSTSQFTAVRTATQKLTQSVDGIFCPSSIVLEPVTAPFCRDYYEQRGQELFLVGPQMHDDEWETPAAGPGPSEGRVKTFLDDARKEYGPKSVLYISFGSWFFPVERRHLVEVMLEVLLSIDAVIPFVFVLAGAMASLPEETIDRIHASGRGLVCAHWVDQKAILKGGTIGWFLTHGGYNSLAEGLSQGIPLIFWPVGAEQGLNAAMLSTGDRPIGVEFFQIRAGTQLGPSLRPEAPNITGTAEDARAEFEQVFSDLKGSRGKTLERNATRIGDLWRQERIDGKPVQEITRLARF
ncbi:unnamed protein product [Mycena citricolor]|uniref:Glycosyltransferase family 1 protein n=1 Tax=Mycena citricolor TaxID=2018698 RepID=A0AAD2HD12_9AGAR|nr:unnamed protein product [Mycena citricolor]